MHHSRQNSSKAEPAVLEEFKRPLNRYAECLPLLFSPESIILRTSLKPTGVVIRTKGGH